MFKQDYLPLIFLLLFLPIFLVNLSGVSLVDFDEAWYAEIARNILTSHNPFILTFNNLPYTDHPPFGFILMVISFAIFGISDFSARLPSALLGFGSIVILYFIGKNLFNKTVGIGAALVLVSCVWFLIRARSANLDSPFLFFYLLTFYFAIKSRKNANYLSAFALSLGLLTLTKTLIGISILIPSLFFIRPNKKLFLAILIFLATAAPYYIVNVLQQGKGFVEHALSIGLRPDQKQPINFKELHLSLTAIYLHYGIREWFYPGTIAFFASILFFFKSKLQLLAIYAWLLFLLFGFLTNKKTEIWHLIVLYAPISLLISFFLFQTLSTASDLLAKIPKPNRLKITTIIFLFLMTALTAKQLYEALPDLNLRGKNISGLSQTAKAAQNRPENLYLDNEFFLPGTVFYSQKPVSMVKAQPYPANTLKGMVEVGPKPALILTETWRLETDKISLSAYKTIFQYQDNVLILVQP